jgi:hypothetical protein
VHFTAFVFGNFPFPAESAGLLSVRDFFPLDWGLIWVGFDFLVEATDDLPLDAQHKKDLVIV